MIPSTDADQDELKYILIRRGANLSQVKKISDADSIESRLSRGRGGGNLIELPTDGSGTTPGEDHIGVVSFDEGMLNSETGFYMHFLPSSAYRHLPPYDIPSFPEIISYPVSQELLDSLPNWALSQLREQGDIKIQAEYTGEEFCNVHEGWHTATNPYDRILQLANEFDGDIIQVVYYLAAENGSGEWSDPETIADIRDIKTESVEEAISKIRRHVEEDTN